MQLMWITFNISNEVIGFVGDKIGIITKYYVVRKKLSTFPQALAHVET